MRTGTRIAIEAGLSAVIAFALSLIVLGPLLGQLDVAWAGGDMLSTYVNTATWSGFSYATTTQFGFPLGMDLNYFPGIDITENAFAMVVNALAGTTFTGLNLLVVLSFPLVAALAYLVIRMTGLQGPLAIALAVAFAVIPFHWGRALGHTYLSTLYSAVVGLALVLLIASGHWAREWSRSSGRRRAGLIAVVAVMCIVVAWTGVYYAVFTLILGAAALLWRFAHRVPWRTLALDAMPFVGVAVLLVIGFLPSLLTLRADPPLAPLGDRSPIESVTNAGGLLMALLPLPQSELPYGGYYNEAVLEVLNQAPFGESTAITNFGTWVTALALLVFLVAVLVRARRGRDDSNASDDNPITLGLVGYLIGVTVLFLVPWGLNLLFAGVVSSQIRAWNRLLPFLLLLILVGAAVALRRTSIARRWAIAVPVAIVLLGLTALDSVYPFRAAYAGSVAEGSEATQAGRDYAAAVNAAIPEDCGVLQLPYLGYPENGRVEGMNDYDHFWQSMTNTGKQWSYGAVRNTDAGVWSAQLPQVPTDEQLALLRGAGFCAVHVDSRGYSTPTSDDVLADLEDRLGPPVATAFDGDWLLFDLRGVDPAPAGEVEAFLNQPFVTVDFTQVTPRETDGQSAWWWTRVPEASITLTPTGPDAPVTSVTGAVKAPECGAVPVTLTLTSGTQQAAAEVLARPGQATPFTLTLAEPSATAATLTVETAGQGCPVDGSDPATPGGERRFAQLLDLSPR